MSIVTGDSLEKFNIVVSKLPLKSNELTRRTNELKRLLINWRYILVPINSLLEWEREYDPLIIFGIITFIFFSILKINPTVLTLVSFVMLIVVMIDLLVINGVHIVSKYESWTQSKETKYKRLCERIAHLETFLKHKCESVLKMRKERPSMYLIVGSICLLFFAYCCQNIDNLLLSYLATLVICLTPGVHNRQLISLIHQYIIDFWNKNKLISSFKNGEQRTARTTSS
ncbi:unnamed protein product [Rotaria socialis]|uniref:RETREG1-3/ARL6IP-like N-terminal reticulon-homology domain-containing protein n=1 Tax=Rotaria socialis TaxID=392032 RepID=A0A817UKW8_9BILA|nr:unnamed protein product [Rotaria socialis]CAF4315376.1 unnamed protein product [Rotaria socialis]